MILDYDNELTYTAGPPATSKQSIVGTAGTAIIGGRVLDGGAAQDWAAGEVKEWFLRCVTALVGADNAGLTTNPVVIATRTIAAASLTANALIPLPSPYPGTKKRFLGVKLTPLSTNSTAGEVIVGIVDKDARQQGPLNYI